MKAYITYSTAISPQESFESEFPWKETTEYTDKLSCIEPVYKEFFPPMKLRRMSRLVKMALTSAKVCLTKAGIEMPDAIITASGWGCLNDTYKYLDEITDENVSSPSPATFIQSTHNTPGGQIALTLGCQNYNNVIVNGNTSFEMALTDAMMLIAEGKNNILVGGFDEIATADYELKKHARYWKEEGVTSSSFLQHNSEGTLPGEGAAFVVLSSEGNESHSALLYSGIMPCIPESKEIKEALNTLLGKHNLDLDSIDIVLSGANGNSKIMPLYNELNTFVFSRAKIVNYKEQCGEFDTASAYALWLADSILKTQKVPGAKESSNAFNNILIYNYSGENKHAITLVQKPGI